MKVKSLSKLNFIAMLCMAIVFSFGTVGCSKKSYKDGEGEASGVYNPDQGEIDSGRADSDNNTAMGLQTVNFPYDSFEITSEAMSVLQNNYEILKENDGLQVQIEGHCDERGGIQYNLALGEKRANALRRKLVSMGIDGSRIETISYGKERPVALGHSESAWSQNRRGNFVITAKE